MKKGRWLVLLLLVSTASASPGQAAPEEKWVSLFDGKSLAGWEGNSEWFRVENQAIVAGSMETSIPRNEFLCTYEQFGDFELTLEVRLTEAKGNAGIQFRTRRIPDHHEVIGYQADVGPGWWGALYDESRRKRILKAPEEELIEKILYPAGWNQYQIQARGSQIRLWLNGELTVNYQEKEPVATTGIICLQIHSGDAAEVWYRHIRLRKLD